MGEFNTDPIVYGQIHPFIVSEGDIVDIIVNNRDPAVHPFHLHGHHFQVLARGPSGAGDWPTPDSNKSHELAVLNAIPPKRDTISVMANSFAVLRFRADNPGVYLFHCHIEWHVEMGLTATIIEAPERLRDLPIPEDHKRLCEAAGIPTVGNAGGSMDAHDTSNYNTAPSKEYMG
jgi:iron transport multicopper oxidase